MLRQMKVSDDLFSKFASTYDHYSEIQQYAFQRLEQKLDEVDRLRAHRILDVGCGTGALTGGLLEKFPNAKGVGLDIAPQMIALAKRNHSSERLQFLHQALEGYAPEQPFDLVVSNAAFQWIPQLKEQFEAIKKIMAPNGSVIVTLFTRETYSELRKALSVVMGKPVILASSAFLESSELDQLVKTSWPTAVTTSEKVQMLYPSLKSLLQSIKFTGTRGQNAPSIQWTPGFFQEVESAYRMMFGQIKATYGLAVVSVYDHD